MPHRLEGLRYFLVFFEAGAVSNIWKKEKKTQIGSSGRFNLLNRLRLSWKLITDWLWACKSVHKEQPRNKSLIFEHGYQQIGGKPYTCVEKKKPKCYWRLISGLLYLSVLYSINYGKLSDLKMVCMGNRWGHVNSRCGAWHHWLIR